MAESLRTGLVAPRSLAADVARMRSGALNPVDYLDQLLERIARTDPEIHAFVTADDERAVGPGRGTVVRQLEEVRRRWPEPGQRPTLYGVPVAVKDVFAVDGYPTRAGSRLPAEVLTEAEAGAIVRLRAAGAVVLGKTETAEFASYAPGPARNPHGTAHSPGGSSSGSAAAVAAGAAPVALGTQTVGSVTRPAAYCGVVGYTPTYARVPTTGLIANAPSFDTVGWFTADVASAALVAAAICDGWSLREDPAPPRIGVPEGGYVEQASHEAREVLREVVERLRAAGHEVVSLTPWPDFGEVRDRHVVINRYEMAESHQPWFDTYGHLYHEVTRDYVEQGRATSQAAYDGALAARREYQARVLATMAEHDVDLWLAPAATGVAPEGIATTGSPQMSLPWTQFGGPVTCLPVTRNADGFPLGVQLVARPGADEDLLAWCRAVEELLAR